MKKRIFAVLLALSLLLGSLPCAIAASITVYVSENTVKVYKSPSTSSKLLGTMAYGESMICTGTEDDWAEVQNPSGATGYCRTSALTKDDPNTLHEKLYAKSDGVKIYKRPDKSSAVLATAKKNDSCTVVAVTEDSQWLRVKNGGSYGYVQAKYLSAKSEEEDSGDTSLAGTKVYVASATLKVYKSASSSSKLLGTLSYGESMTLSSLEGSWAKVLNPSGAAGYCKFDSLSTSDPNDMEETLYLDRDGAPIYSKASTSSKVLKKGSEGDQITAVAETPDGEWLRVKRGSGYGYVLSYMVTDKAPEKPSEDEPSEDESFDGSTVYIISNTLKVYKQASSSSKLLGTLSYGEKLTLASVDGRWAKVQNGAGATGYCKVDSLSTANPNKEETTAYAAQDGVKAYAKPDEDAKVLDSFDRNDKISVTAVTPDEAWARVYIGSGKYGYVKTRYLSKKQSDDSDADAEVSFIQDIRKKTVYVADTNLSFRASPNSSAESVATLSFGASLSCDGEGGGWSRVENGGKTAYCKTASLTETNPNKHSVTLYAKDGGAKLYSRASRSSTQLGTLSAGKSITGVAISPDEDWIRVKNGSDYAYLQADDVTTEQKNDNAAAINAVIDLAKAQLGKKYVYGADGPSQFDCSSLTQYCFKNAAGLKLNRLAQQQGYDSRYSRITSTSKLKKGDLVFFNTNSSDSDLCDHVGIYLGSGQFIHASSAAGKVVISSLSSGYYSRTFSWGMTVL